MKRIAFALVALFSFNTFALDWDYTLQRLSSQDAQMRDWARESMSALQPEQLPQVMEALRINSEDYWVKSGIVVGLTNMIGRSPEKRDAISKNLSDKDIQTLVTLVADDQRYVGTSASYFMTALKDGRSVEVATGMVAQVQGKNRKEIVTWLVEIARASLANY